MSIVSNEVLENFYGIELIPKRNFNYSLTTQELKKLNYEQLFIENLKGVVIKSKNYHTDEETNKILSQKYSADLIYRHPGKGGAFGDSLGWASFIYRLSEAHKKKIKVVEFYGKCLKIKKEILQTSGEVEILEKKPDTPFFQLNGGTKGGYREIYSTLFLPAKYSWTTNKNRKVGYQFGKLGLIDRRIQNPKDEELILETLIKNGYQPIELGGHLNNEECCKLASEVNFFVGTCSGMSHLCHSVGTPVHMLTNQRSLERVSVGHVNNSRSPIPTIFWQHPHHFVEFLNNAKK